MVSSLSFSSPAPFFAVKSLTLILIGTNWERSPLLLLPLSLRSIIRNTRGAISDCLPILQLFKHSSGLLQKLGSAASFSNSKMLYSGVVAGAREALISGVPSLSIFLKWKPQNNDKMLSSLSSWLYI